MRILFRSGFVGQASESEVRIRWARKFVSNDLAPEFRGAVSPDQRFVRGNFRQRRWVLALILVSVALALGAMVVALQSGNEAMGQRGLVLLPVALVALALLLPRLGWVMARADIERITGLLHAAARGEARRVESR